MSLSQLAEIRRQKQLDYARVKEEEKRQEKLGDFYKKYRNLIDTDQIRRSSIRIIRYLKKSWFKDINNEIEGKFLVRKRIYGGEYKFWDISIIGPYLKESEIYEFEGLDAFQIEDIKKQWEKIDITTSSGMNYLQKFIDLDKCIVMDSKEEWIKETYIYYFLRYYIKNLIPIDGNEINIIFQNIYDKSKLKTKPSERKFIKSINIKSLNKKEINLLENLYYCKYVIEDFERFVSKIPNWLGKILYWRYY